MAHPPDYYAVLRVPRHSTPDDIKKAFHRLAKQYHPDVNPDDETAGDLFKAVNEAYGVLSDPADRRAYDAANRWAGAGMAWSVDDDGGARVASWASSASASSGLGAGPTLPRRAYVRHDAGVGRGQSTAEARADPLDHEAWVRGHATASAGSSGGSASTSGFSPFGTKPAGRAEAWEARRAAARARAAATSAGTVVTDSGTTYRQWAQQFRHAQRASERWWPLAAAGWVAGLAVVYLVTRRR
jgi:curved DNA-binding protein CbpA